MVWKSDPLTPPGHPPARSPGFRYKVALRLELDGPVITEEPVLESDLVDVKCEAWLALLRRGRPDAGFNEVSTQVLPVWKKGDEPVCTAFLIETTGPGGDFTHTQFEIEALWNVADRASRALLKAGTLKPGQLYYFELLAERVPWSPASASAAEPEARSGRFSLRQMPLVHLTEPIEPLLAGAQAVGRVDGWCPFFYTREVLDRAERYARRGSQSQPAAESGGVILGSLCSCPSTGEFYVVANDVIEVTDARQTPFSLSYSGKTWGRIQAVVRARQANPATRAQRIIGQAHGHNFMPDYGIKKCEQCAELPTCTLTSVFVSDQDLLWSKSVFVRQPWAVCHIFGLDARGLPVHGQFGFRGGRLVERGFYLIDGSRSGCVD